MRATTLTIGPTFRSMNRIAPTIVAGAAVVIALVIGGPTPPPVSVLLRVLAVVIAAGAAGMLDDPAQPSLGASPVPLSRRLVVRGGLGLLLAWGAWSLTAAILVARFGPDGLPFGRLALEFATLTGLVVAAASAALRSGQPTGMPAGATAALAFAFTSLHLPSGVTLLGAAPGTSAYTAETSRWVFVLLAGAAAVAFSARDPARTARRLRRDR